MSLGEVLFKVINLLEYIHNTRPIDPKIVRATSTKLLYQLERNYTNHCCPGCGNIARGFTVGDWWVCLECGYEATNSDCEEEDVAAGVI